ncbi:hypothetical protein BT63DRAFT_422063 [Microthyrium microscopicum]|uniref:Uncharacterized protein n=1 Tax=Microthyrium microscopicum TaxID=703497 RepID=A0A6A6UQD8_9PEZI|nr:hypothetical protein BT63DRAFT_422063 [Microthyrium microscopicum]
MASIFASRSQASQIAPTTPNARNNPDDVNASNLPDTNGRYPKRKRATVKYTLSDSEQDSSDSEAEYIFSKRVRKTISNRPLPKRKIFPFLSLPAELRNKIYKECLCDAHLDPNGGPPAIWMQSKQRAYRRGLKRTVPEDEDWANYNYGERYGGRGYAYSSRRRAGSPADSDDDAEGGKPGDKILSVHLLAVCKQIYAEAAPFIYGQKLVFASTGALVSFGAALSERTAKLIRHVEVKSWGLSRTHKNVPYLAFTLLAAKGVTNLETLSLNCSLGYFYSYSWRSTGKSTAIPKRVARQVYRHCYPWLEAVAADRMAKSDDPEALYAGVNILQIHANNLKEGQSYGAKLELKDVKDEVEMYRKELKKLMRSHA